MHIIVLQILPPVHGLSGEELQLIVVQAEAAEGEESSERIRRQVVQGVMAKTNPLDVVQALEEELDRCGIILPNIIMCTVYVCSSFLHLIPISLSTWKAMLGM